MKGYVYILKCADGSFYTGSTTNINVRLWQHQQGEGAKHTANRLPVELVYLEEFEQIDTAFFREKQIQGWSRQKKIALIEKQYHQLPKFSECQNQSHYKNLPIPVDGFDSAQPPSNSAQLLPNTTNHVQYTNTP